MQISTAQDSDRELWDSMVDRSENGTIHHTWAWLKLLEQYSVLKKAGMTGKAVLEPLIISENNEPVGICPLFFFRVAGITWCYSPLSREDTLFLGPLFPGLEKKRQRDTQTFLLDASREIDRFIRKDRKASYVHISTTPGFGDSRPFRWAGYRIDPRYTYFVDLSAGSEAIFKGFEKNLRYLINKARKDGITVEEGNKDDALYIWDLLKQRGRVKFRREFLSAACDVFYPNTLKVFLARNGDDRLSGSIVLLYKDKFSLWIGSAKVPGSSINEIIIWECIEWAAAHGYKTFEIVGADDYPLFGFKRKWNGIPVQYFDMNWSSPPLNAAMSLFNALFRDRNQIADRGGHGKE